MSLFTIVNNNIQFNLLENWIGKVHVRFRGNTVRTAEVFADDESLVKWSGCPGSDDPVSVDQNQWANTKLVDGPALCKVKVRHEQLVLCNGTHSADDIFAMLNETHLFLLPGFFVLSQWEFHDENGNYVDIVVVLEDDGSGTLK